MTGHRYSITVPVGAWHPFLPHCLASLAAQQADVEIALLDASDDPRVRACADRFGDRIAYRFHGPDAGQADAIAKGWENTDGDILGWLNADDILFPDTLARVDTAFAQQGADVVYGHSTIIDETMATTGWQYGVEPPSGRLGHAAIVSQPSCFFRREACERAGWLDTSLHYTMDWDLFIRLFRSGARFAFVDDALSQVLWAGDTKTASLSRRRRHEIRRILTLYPGTGPDRPSFRGFVTQHVIDLAPPFVRHRLMRMLMRGGRIIKGLAADGRIDADASLPLCSYGDAGHTSVALRVGTPAAIAAVTLNGRACDLEVAGQTVIARGPGSLPPAERITAGITVSAPCYLRGAALIP